MKKRFKGIFTIVILLMVFIPFVKVNALEYDSTKNPVVGLSVKEDGTISWQKTLDAYGIWVKHEGNSYATALKNANSASFNTVNLIDLIEEKCVSASYGCPVVDGAPTKTGTFIVLIKEDVGTGTITNSEFTITYDGTKLSGTIVESVSTFNVTFNTDGGSAIPSQEVAEGSKVTKPANPTKDGYEFMYWGSDTGKTIDDEITANTTFIAQWVKKFNIIEGPDQSFYLESDKDITIVADGPFDEFDSFALFCDNRTPIYMSDLTEGTDYILEEGSTKLTLKNSFLKTLTSDKYYVEFYYANAGTYGNGYTDTTLTVKDGSEPATESNNTTETTSNPPTSDNVLFYISMLSLSIIGLARLRLYNKNKRFN